jgi:hypothetical protein
MLDDLEALITKSGNAPGTGTSKAPQEKSVEVAGASERHHS